MVLLPWLRYVLVFALMDGGIQIKEHVAGIGDGMIAEGDRMVILSDILGDEDALGDMDFKVTGTSKGICGLPNGYQNRRSSL